MAAARERRTMHGCASVVHSAAVLGGSGQDMETFRRVNTLGTATVATYSEGMTRRLPAASGTAFDNIVTRALLG